MSKEMEAMYIEELKSSVNQLMANLESMPVSKGGEFKIQKLKRGHNTSIIDMGQEDENTLSKSDVVLSFTLEVHSLMRTSGTYVHEEFRDRHSQGEHVSMRSTCVLRRCVAQDWVGKKVPYRDTWVEL